MFSVINANLEQNNAKTKHAFFSKHLKLDFQRSSGSLEQNERTILNLNLLREQKARNDFPCFKVNFRKKRKKNT